MDDRSRLVAGEPIDLLPGIRRLLAPNPSVMTGPGTNTYLIGDGDLVVIDPGPDDARHLERIIELSEGRIRYVLVTHSHRDHAPGARPLARAVGATLLGFDERTNFIPDGRVGEGDIIVADRWRLTAMHTPGHSSDHLCYVADAVMEGAAESTEQPRVLFSGDHVMEGSTVVIGPPDGDMRAYFASLERLKGIEPPVGLIAPGHGMLIDDPLTVIDSYLALRRRREAAIHTALLAGPARAAELVPKIYSDLPEALVRHAGRSVWAHLRKLHEEGRAVTDDPDDPESIWSV